MSITRKTFLNAAGVGSVILFLQACGGGDDDGAPLPAPGPAPGPGPQQCGSSGGAVSGNHGHALVIPAAALDSPSAVTYDIRGNADHPHSVTFTPAQLQELKAGQSVTVLSTTNASHDHSVTATCA